MRFCSAFGFIVVLGLTLSVAYGKHKREHHKRHQNHKHSRLLNISHLKSHRTASHHSHSHVKDHPAPTGLKCRKAKFIINRNVYPVKDVSNAAKRHMKKKHAKQILHKLVKSHKRFRLPKETKLFEDKEGRLVTYIEDCVDSEQADKKDSFGEHADVVIAPEFEKSKKRHHQHSDDENESNVDSRDEAIGEEDILPASEDSLLQTVSDSTEILKENAQKEGAAQFISDQHDTEIPSNFATVFQAATLDNPLPKKAEEGSEMQKFFTSTGLGNVQLPPLPGSDEYHSPTNGDLQSDQRMEGNVVTPISNQPVNIPESDRPHNNPMQFSSEMVNNPAPPQQTDDQGGQNSVVAQSLGSQGLQNARLTTLGSQGNVDVTAQLLRNPGPSEYTSQLRNQDIAHVQFTDNSLGEESHVLFPGMPLTEPADSFTDAFEKLRNPEAQELASIVNNGPVPQTLEGAMKEEKAEASYENKFEKVFGKSNALGLQKGAAFIPRRQGK